MTAGPKEENVMRTIVLSSYAGLTRLRGRSRFGEAKARVSIHLRKSRCKGMDCRVKPGNDEKRAHARTS
jgi:hypothetical protein